MQLLIVLMTFAIVIGVHSELESCDSGKGVCIDTNTMTCADGKGYLKPGYCPGPANILCCERPFSIPESCYGSGPQLINNSFLYTLDNQGFPGNPGALVYIPSTFDAAAALENLELVIYVHGYSNCIRYSQSYVVDFENSFFFF